MPRAIASAEEIMAKFDAPVLAEDSVAPVVPITEHTGVQESPRAKFDAPGMASLASAARASVTPGKPYEQPRTNTWVFVKNIFRCQKIKLPDGTFFQFKTGRLVTSDEKLANQLIAVAKRYHIIIESVPTAPEPVAE